MNKQYAIGELSAVEDGIPRQHHFICQQASQSSEKKLPSRKCHEDSGAGFRSGTAGYVMRVYDRACGDQIDAFDATDNI